MMKTDITEIDAIEDDYEEGDGVWEDILYYTSN